jgi:copper(I)-binding protein
MQPVRVFLVGGLWAVAAITAAAQPAGLQVETAWALPQDGPIGLVHVTVQTNEDRLLSVWSPVAASAAVQDTVRQGDRVQFTVGLSGLRQILRAGDVLSVFLVFERAGRVAAAVLVQPAGDAPPARVSGMHMEGLPTIGAELPGARN